ncbi:MAG TPA: glucan biosynthesis protein D [Methylocella sp.]|nr:glucan biosynthesis protein D [Methylocella sp.]
MVERREVLKLVLSGIAVPLCIRAIGESAAQERPAQDPLKPVLPGDFALGEPSAFDPGMVTEAARSLSKQPFRPLPSDLPNVFRNLTYEQYAAIRQRPGTAIWAAENIGFMIEPLHRGFLFSSPVEINLVAEAKARRILYDPALFDFDKITVASDIGDIGFSGFRVLAQGQSGFFELAIFQGASFFRATAPGQTLGTMARAMSIKTADPRGEEFPAFRTVWIERPTLAASALVIHALIDSESVSGAYRFTLRPGDATIIDTECALFARVAVDNLGLATMSATHLSGPIGERHDDDLRPSVSEVSGLQMLTGKGEWLWRPVANRDTLQISTFVDETPHGFGFLQRDRNFDHYQDDDQHFETRPSLWIEPIGDWSSGSFHLIEIPSTSETNRNIIGYWKPKQTLAAGSETFFAYRQFWCWNPPQQPPLAISTQSRSGRGSSPKRRRFLVEFSGAILSSPENMDALKPNLNVAPGSIVAVRTFPSADKKSCRILFEIDPGNEPFSEMRLVLEAGGKPLSETWLYRWTL